jgi:hypothetical protein
MRSLPDAELVTADVFVAAFHSCPASSTPSAHWRVNSVALGDADRTAVGRAEAKEAMARSPTRKVGQIIVRRLSLRERETLRKDWRGLGLRLPWNSSSR